MSHRMGDDDGWGSGSWHDFTERVPHGEPWEAPAGGTGSAPNGGFGPTPAGGMGSAPTGGSSGKGAAWAVVGVVAGVVILALLAVAAFFVLNRDTGAEAQDVATSEVADGPAWTEPPAVPESAVASTSAASTAATSAGRLSGSDLAPTAGTYTGTLSQRGTRHSDQDFTVRMTFSSSGSTVEYPTLDCRGTLTPVGDENGARVYREAITDGRCEPTGTWHVTVGSSNAISAEYQPATDDYVVVGQLTK